MTVQLIVVAIATGDFQLTATSAAAAAVTSSAIAAKCRRRQER